ncbi:MAG: glucuronate isomerase [Ruminococcaceae bacterium]|nr:glucuronate isomerase [Oscillospiraceae bacterium]
MAFIKDNFMLHSKTAEKLFHDYAKDLPIIDYHCHLQPKMIAENYQFKSTYDLFLGGDHYKWRQMRSNGVPEEYITGDKDDFSKWEKWADTLSLLIGNPLYHWTHLELDRYFGIKEPMTLDNCKSVWDKCNELLKRDDFRAQALIKKSNVEVICTTDDPIDTLEYHEQLKDFETKILPTFRPDKAVEIGKETFVPYINNAGIKTYEELLNWLSARIEFFNAHGCRLSDHALEAVPFALGDAKAVFEKRMNGGELTVTEIDVFRTAVLKHCASEYVKLGWTMQLHIGALRNNNTKMYHKLGADTGFDSINDLEIAASLSRFMDNLEVDDALPKTILYTLNPKDNYVLGTMLGNFQKSPTAGKIQFGSGWWFNDHRDGMEDQMRALANLGMLANFVGMLTDSRSFVSYTRHEYFRRIFCNLIGSWVEAGEYPKDWKMLEKIVKGVCYNNAKNYFNF